MAYVLRAALAFAAARRCHDHLPGRLYHASRVGRHVIGCWLPAMSVRATGSRCGPAAVARSWWTAARHSGAMRACLDRLGIRRVPLLIITHFHADHVAGLAGVLRHRRVGQLWLSPLAPPGPLMAMVRQPGCATAGFR